MHNYFYTKLTLCTSAFHLQMLLTWPQFVGKTELKILLKISGWTYDFKNISFFFICEMVRFSQLYVTCLTDIQFLHQRKEIWHLFCYFPHKELKIIFLSLQGSWRYDLFLKNPSIASHKFTFVSQLPWEACPISIHSIWQAVILKGSNFFIKIQFLSWMSSNR